MSTTTEEKKLIDVCRDLGLTIESSAPLPRVDGEKTKTTNPWPHIAYTVTIKRKDRTVWSGPYKLGIGHVDLKKINTNPSVLLTFGFEELSVIEHTREGRQLKDKQLVASVCTKVAKIQKVSPKLDDVMSSLILDGSPHLQHETFDDWCSNFGESNDSIRARRMYDTCIETGIALARAFTTAELEQLQDAASNH